MYQDNMEQIFRYVILESYECLYSLIFWFRITDVHRSTQCTTESICTDVLVTLKLNFNFCLLHWNCKLITSLYILKYSI